MRDMEKPKAPSGREGIDWKVISKVSSVDYKDHILEAFEAFGAYVEVDGTVMVVNHVEDA